MNNLIATVIEIDNCDSLYIVKFNLFGQTLTMVNFELNDKIEVDTKVKLIVKPFNIAIAKNFIGEISYSNKLDTTIKSIENGQILSSIKLSFFDATLESIITLNSSQRMDLKADDKVIALIKANELSIGEIIND